MYRTTLLGLAVMGRTLGYAAVVCVTRHTDPHIAPCYALILAAELIQIGLAVWLWRKERKGDSAAADDESIV